MENYGDVSGAGGSDDGDGGSDEGRSAALHTTGESFESMDSFSSEHQVVEHSPQGRYVRFNVKFSSGAVSKEVWKAYDTSEGVEVAWNTLCMRGIPRQDKQRIIHEIKILEKLDHPNIISFYTSWFNREQKQIVFITELMNTGSLMEFVEPIPVLRWKIVKKWAKQILEGLGHLHSQKIIHRNINCDNIFIVANKGLLKIGDLGLSTVCQKAASCVGTAPFMAPELFEEDYDEKVDIYAFGMTILQMITKETPYAECENVSDIYRRVVAFVPPASLSRVANPNARAFIELCLLGDPTKRPSAEELLEHHPFLQANKDEDGLEVVLAPPECGSVGRPIADMTKTLSHASSLGGYFHASLSTVSSGSLQSTPLRRGSGGEMSYSSSGALLPWLTSSNSLASISAAMPKSALSGTTTPRSAATGSQTQQTQQQQLAAPNGSRLHLRFFSEPRGSLSELSDDESDVDWQQEMGHKDERERDDRPEGGDEDDMSASTRLQGTVPANKSPRSVWREEDRNEDDDLLSEMPEAESTCKKVKVMGSRNSELVEEPSEAAATADSNANANATSPKGPRTPPSSAEARTEGLTYAQVVVMGAEAKQTPPAQTEHKATSTTGLDRNALAVTEEGRAEDARLTQSDDEKQELCGMVVAPEPKVEADRQPVPEAEQRAGPSSPLASSSHNNPHTMDFGAVVVAAEEELAGEGGRPQPIASLPSFDISVRSSNSGGSPTPSGHSSSVPSSPSHGSSPPMSPSSVCSMRRVQISQCSSMNLTGSSMLILPPDQAAFDVANMSLSMPPGVTEALEMLNSSQGRALSPPPLTVTLPLCGATTTQLHALPTTPREDSMSDLVPPPSPLHERTESGRSSSGRSSGQIMTLLIRTPVNGRMKEVEFDFNLATDQPLSVAREMVTELGIPEKELEDITRRITMLKEEQLAKRNARREARVAASRASSGQAPSSSSTSISATSRPVSPPLAESPNARTQPQQQQSLPQGTNTSLQTSSTVTSAGSPAASNAYVVQRRRSEQAQPSRPPLQPSGSCSGPGAPLSSRHRSSSVGSQLHRLPYASAPGGQGQGQGHHPSSSAPAVGPQTPGSAGSTPLRPGCLQTQPPTQNTHSNAFPSASTMHSRAYSANSLTSSKPSASGTHLPRCSSSSSAGSMLHPPHPTLLSRSSSVDTLEEELDCVSVSDDMADEDDDEDTDPELQRLKQEYLKSVSRAQKAFKARMESWEKCREEKEKDHRRLLEKFEKDMAEFNRRLHMAEDERLHRLHEMREQWQLALELHRESVKARQRTGSSPTAASTSTTTTTTTTTA